MIFTKYQDIIEKYQLNKKLHFFTEKNLPKYIFNGEWGRVVQVKRSFNKFNGGKNPNPWAYNIAVFNNEKFFSRFAAIQKNKRLCVY